MDLGEFNECRLYTKLRLDYTVRLWAPTSASCAISAVAELFVLLLIKCFFTELNIMFHDDPIYSKKNKKFSCVLR